MSAVLARRLAVLGLAVFAFSPSTQPASATPEKPPAAPPVCGAPDTGGIFKEPPSIRVWQVAKSKDGLPHIVLRAEGAGPRFCFRDATPGASAAYADPPVLRVRPGDRFVLRLVNDLPRKKRARMTAMAMGRCAPMAMQGPPPRAFTGYLSHVAYDRWVRMPDEDVNIHLHGFTGPASQENIFLSTFDSRTCDYTVTIPRTQIPGTYYYHPHAHGIADDEVAQGLSGMWIVEPPSAPLGPSNEHVAILRYRVPFINDNNYAPAGDDLTAAAVARIRFLGSADPKPIAYDPFNPPAWPSSFPMRGPQTTLDRCHGFFPTPLLSINGVDAPVRLNVAPGTPQLLRLLNATSDTFNDLKLRDTSGKAVPLRVLARDGTPVGGDAQNPYAHYTERSDLFFADASRADLLLTVPAGQDVTLYTDHTCESPIGEYMQRHDLLTIHGEGAEAQTRTPVFRPAPLQPAQNRALALVRYARAHPSLIRKRAIAYTEYAVPGRGKHPPELQFFITDITNPNFSEHPFWPAYASGASTPTRADIVVKAGSIEEWTLLNTTLEIHSFHIHQMNFVAEDEAGGPAFLDTVPVRVGTILPNRADPDFPLIRPSKTHVLLDFRHVRRGTFVFHCHVLFHEDHGMMGVIRVV